MLIPPKIENIEEKIAKYKNETTSKSNSNSSSLVNSEPVRLKSSM